MKSKKRNRKLKFELHEVEFSASRLVTYYGNIGEIIAEEVLKKQGFETWLLTRYSYAPIDEDYEEPLNLSRLRRHYDNLKLVYGDSLKETWEEYRDEIYERHLKATQKVEVFFGDKLEDYKQYSRKIHLDEYRYSPDLMAKKDGKIYVIEVKSSKRARKYYLKGKKLRGLMLAREYGFIPTVITLEVQIEATEFEFEEL